VVCWTRTFHFQEENANNSVCPLNEVGPWSEKRKYSSGRWKTYHLSVSCKIKVIWYNNWICLTWHDVKMDTSDLAGMFYINETIFFNLLAYTVGWLMLICLMHWLYPLWRLWNVNTWKSKWFICTSKDVGKLSLLKLCVNSVAFILKTYNSFCVGFCIDEIKHIRIQ
jgi:hypothetical protein